MYKTRLGYERLNYTQKRQAREFLASLPIAFRCTCNQCYCGCMDTVIYRQIPYCRCGRPQIDNKGNYCGTDHSWFCSKQQDTN